MIRLLFMLLCLSCVAVPVHAQTAFVMEPQLETERVEPAVRAQVLKALRESLRSRGVTVLSVDKVKQRGVACQEHACVAAALDTLSADFGVQVTMLATPGGETGALGSVGVAFHERELVYRAPAVRIMDSGIERAVDDGVRIARERQKRGAGPWFVIDGTPQTVELHLDGKRVDVCQMPCQLRVSPDRSHVLSVAAFGYRKKEILQIVGSDLAETYELLVQLEVDSATQGATSTHDSGTSRSDESSTSRAAVDPLPSETAPRRKWAHIAGPLTLGVAGLGLMVAGVAQMPRRGCSEEASNGFCTRDGEVATGPLVGWEVSGALLITGGILWYSLGRRASTRVGTNGTALQVRGVF